MTEIAIADQIRALIRDVPNFPKPGILFKDLCPIWESGEALRDLATAMSAPYASEDIDAIVAIESRGFLVGTAMAMHMGKGVVLVRKKGKLPGKVVGQTYDLEYGQDTLEVQESAITPGKKVVVVDDLLATGGTVNASLQLIQGLGAQVVGTSFIVELAFLKGRAALGDVPCHAVVSY